MRLSHTLKPAESGVLLVDNSRDSKLSKDASISVTLVAQDSCPDSCPLKPSLEHLRDGSAGTCYSRTGNMNNHTYRVNSTGPHKPLELAAEEARLIEQSTGERDLRLHTVGACPDRLSIRRVARAARIYSEKHQKTVWTYTHTEGVHRAAWGTVKVWKSCHTERQVEEAHRLGYPAAMVIPHTTRKKYALGNGFTVVVCPNQTTKNTVKLTCAECRICLDRTEEFHAKKMVVGFMAHGQLKDEQVNLIALALGR